MLSRTPPRLRDVAAALLSTVDHSHSPTMGALFHVVLVMSSVFYSAIINTELYCCFIASSSSDRRSIHQITNLHQHRTTWEIPVRMGPGFIRLFPQVNPDSQFCQRTLLAHV